ncbi:hypothetical protein [Crenobacter cavernae]|uniref:DUF4136 domain-containing protein n=1 Tax=Crenobacter cavernae TaxID=2290923 RepID=A0A345Y4H6_9NEIS|nr:hypothetical protein [Crenobacter cavernae]AXK38828.1 hypothetical protein DWG20_04935 [Crenobacter cavernae]
MKPLTLISGLALAAVFAAAPADAALPGEARYAIDCVPGDTGTLGDWLRTRLALRGFEEDAARPTLRLCFRVNEVQRVVPDQHWSWSWGWGIGAGHHRHGGFGGVIWDTPVYSRVETAREVVLTATRPGAGAPYWEDREPLSGRGKAPIEAALRRLIERLPAPHY